MIRKISTTKKTRRSSPSKHSNKSIGVSSRKPYVKPPKPKR